MMLQRNGRSPLAALLVGAVLAAASVVGISAPSQAAPAAVDQTTSGVADATYGSLGSQYLRQTFTPGVTGKLTRIAVQGPGGSPALLSVYSVDQSGAIGGLLAGPMVLHGTVDGTFPTPPVLTAGATYAFQVSAAQNEVKVSGYGTSDHYAAGDLASGSQGTLTPLNADLAFTTYMIPAPSAPTALTIDRENSRNFSALATWTPATDATADTRYEVRWGASGTGTSTWQTVSSLTGPSAVLAMPRRETYDVQVRASEDGMTSAWVSATSKRVVAAITASATPGTAYQYTSIQGSLTVSGGISATGTWELLIDGVSVCSRFVTIDTTAILSCPKLVSPYGTHWAMMSYSGDVTYAASRVENSFTVSAATPAISLAPPTTQVAGASANMVATVSGPSGAPAPSGTVQFYDTGSQSSLCASVTIAGGKAMCTYTVPAAGAPHPIEARYSGDAVYSALTSSTREIESTRSAAKLRVTPRPASAVLGDSVRVTVAATSTGPVTPTGVVRVSAASGATCTGTLSAGAAECTLTGLAVSDESVTAELDATGYNTAASASAGISISKRTPTVAVDVESSSGGPVVAGGQTVATARVSGSGPTPSGTVTFSGAGSACSATTVTGGLATCEFTALSAASSATLTAAYAGDAGYSSRTATAVVTPTRSNVTLTVAPARGSILTGEAVTVLATAASDGPVTPSGSLTVSAASGASCTLTLVAGTGACTLGALAYTDTLLTGVLPQDGYNLGASATATIAVARRDAVIEVNVPDDVVAGAPTVASVDVNGAAGTPSGLVSFSGAGTACADVVLDDGVAECAFTALSAEQVEKLTLTYSGDATYLSGSTSSGDVAPERSTSTLEIAATPTTSSVGDTVRVDAVATSDGPVTPSGAVHITAPSGAECDIALDADGAGSCTLTGLTAADDELSASLGADEYTTSATTTTPITVGKLTPSVTLTASATDVVDGTSVHLTTTVAGGAIAPSGRVLIAVDGSELCAAHLVGGTAECDAAALAVGAHTIVATYRGDETYGSGTASVSVRVTAQPAPPAPPAEPDDAAPTRLPAAKLRVTGADAVTPVGEKLRVRASGLAGHERYTVTLGGRTIATGHADDDGKVRVRAVTKAAGGTVKVTGSTPQRRGTDAVRVVARTKTLAVTTSAIPWIGSNLPFDVTVRGLAAGERVTLRFRGEVVETGRATSKGRFVATVSAGWSWGYHTVTATGAGKKRTGSAVVDVERRLD
jgi:hypothetical protein